VTVKTKKKGKAAGSCKVSASVKSDKTSGKRVDKDTVTLSCMPSTATCPTSSTTSTTMPPPPSSSLSFTTAPGTPSCGAARLSFPPAATTSGEIDADTTGSTKISDLGLGCLYFGGGNASSIPPGLIPDSAASFLAITGDTTLGPSAGTGYNSC